MKKNFFFAFLLGSFFLGCSSDDGVTDEPVNPTEDNPVATDDSFNAVENAEFTFSGDDLLENDEIVDSARITAIDTESSEGGTIEDNRDGTYTYMPPTDYQGNDTFTYSLCVPGDSDRCSTATVMIEVGDAGSPVAEDDSYEVEEDKELVIKNFLENDALIDNAQVTSVDSDGTNATVILNEDGEIVYTPNESFAGVDTFTYTICDDDEEPSCSTATITVTVIDEGDPVAKDDTVVVEVDASGFLISDLLLNDTVIDGASITSIDDSSSNAAISLNEDGTISYTPSNGFVGEDTFEYSLCDDDQPEATCSTAKVTVNIVEPIAFNIPSDIEDYYNGVTLSQDPDLLKQALSQFTIAQHVNILAYTDRHDYLYDADADPDNPDNVILMYSGERRYWREYTSGSNSYSPQTFNTEHIYPQSKLTTEDAVTDLHHLRSADASINSLRLNYPYVDGSGEYGVIDGNNWYPGDEWKGDVARMIFYLNIRYGETFDKVGGLDLFLKWNAEDPVSEFELQRNNVIEGAQGDRNPFIDNPYLATLIWGGTAAENRWE